MRTLVSMRDVQLEAVKLITCPRCGPESPELPLVQCHLEMSSKGKILVQKGAVCSTHGYFTCTKHIKAVVMHGKDAQIIPQY